MTRKGMGSIYKDSRGYWTAVVELPPIDGKRRRKPIRSKSKAKVIEALAKMRQELRDRGDLPTVDQTAEQWFTYWVEQIAAKEVRPKTLDGYRRVIVKHVIPTIGSVKLNKLTAAHVRRVHDRITVDLGLSSTYALLTHRVMSASLKAAMREGRIGRNPAELTNAPRKSAAALEVLDLDEALRVLEHVAHDPVMGARWATALLTGARRGEVLGIQHDRVTDVLDLSWQLQRLPGEPGRPVAPADFEFQHLIGGLYLTRPKSSKGWRVIPLVDPLRTILDRHAAAAPVNEWGLLFSRGGRPLDPDQDSKAWRAVLAETGIEKDVRLHDLRHTHIDLLYLAGVPEDIIMEIAGHSVRSVTRGYKSRGNRERLVAAMESFSLLLSSPGSDRRPAVDG